MLDLVSRHNCLSASFPINGAVVDTDCDTAHCIAIVNAIQNLRLQPESRRAGEASYVHAALTADVNKLGKQQNKLATGERQGSELPCGQAWSKRRGRASAGKSRPGASGNSRQREKTSS